MSFRKQKKTPLNSVNNRVHSRLIFILTTLVDSLFRIFFSHSLSSSFSLPFSFAWRLQFSIRRWSLLPFTESEIQKKKEKKRKA